MRQIMFSCFNSDKIVRQSAGFAEYRLNLSGGSGKALIYSVFPGAEVVLLQIQAESYRPCSHNYDNILEINHCHKGRAECIMSDGCLQYLGENDIFLTMQRNRGNAIELPLGFYTGIDVLLELDMAANELPKMLPDFPINPRAIADGFFKQDNCFFIQSKEELRNIYSGMYIIDENARFAYFRLKLLELLIYLSGLKPGEEPQKKAYGRQSVETIKEIQKQITSEPGRRYTIESLARQHCISETALKANFKDVYGKSIAAYMKEYRIRQAARLLMSTQKSIAEIAAQMGYESQSKFGAAFKEIMNTSPSDYRKKRR